MMYQVAASHMLPESQYTMQEKLFTFMIYICKTIEDFTHITVLGAFSSLFLKYFKAPLFYLQHDSSKAENICLVCCLPTLDGFWGNIPENDSS